MTDCKQIGKGHLHMRWLIMKKAFRKEEGNTAGATPNSTGPSLNPNPNPTQGPTVSSRIQDDHCQTYCSAASGRVVRPGAVAVPGTNSSSPGDASDAQDLEDGTNATTNPNSLNAAHITNAHVVDREEENRYIQDLVQAAFEHQQHAVCTVIPDEPSTEVSSSTTGLSSKRRFYFGIAGVLVLMVIAIAVVLAVTLPPDDPVPRPNNVTTISVDTRPPTDPPTTLPPTTLPPTTLPPTDSPTILPPTDTPMSPTDTPTKLPPTDTPTTLPPTDTPTTLPPTNRPTTHWPPPPRVTGEWRLRDSFTGNEPNDAFGFSTDLSQDGSLLAVGAHQKNLGISPGYAKTFRTSGGHHTGTILGEAFDDASGKVSLSADGLVLAISATHNDGVNGGESGHVRVYDWFGQAWRLIGEFDGEAGRDFSGNALSLSDDGTTLAIGAHYNDGVANWSGHVRVFVRTPGDTWSQVGDDIDGLGEDDEFGKSVALSADGVILAAGASQKDVGSHDKDGYVRVFRRTGNTWSPIGQAIQGDFVNENSGFSVALSADGQTLAIGSPFIHTAHGGSTPGRVRVFRNTQGTWSQIGTDIVGSYVGDRFGRPVSLSSNGGILAIGCWSGNYVRVYNYQVGQWTRTGQELTGEESGDSFGQSVSISGDGNLLAIGAPSYSSSVGKVYLYEFVS